MIRSIFKQMLCILMVLFPQAHAYSPAVPELEDDLETRAVLIRERLLADYAKLKSVPQFVEEFAHARPEVEKSELIRRLSMLKRLPKLERIENGIRLSMDSLSLKVDMRSMAKRRFIINGQVFTVAPNLSWVIQSEILMDKLEHPRPERYSLFSLLIPEAQAIAPVVLAGLTVIATGIVNVVISHWGNDSLNALDWEACDVMKRLGNGELPRNPKVCKEYRKEMDDLIKKMPANDAVKNALEDGSSKNEKYITGKDEICPDQVKDQHYHGMVTIVPKVEESIKSDEESKLVRIYAQVDGVKLKSASVYRDEYVNGESKSLLMANYLVDSNSVLDEIVLPTSSKAGSDSSGRGVRVAKKNKDDLTIRIRASADLKDQPELQAQQAFYQGLFKHLGDRLKMCKIKSEEREAGKKIGQPPAPGSMRSGKGAK